MFKGSDPVQGKVGLAFHPFIISRCESSVSDFRLDSKRLVGQIEESLDLWVEVMLRLNDSCKSGPKTADIRVRTAAVDRGKQQSRRQSDCQINCHGTRFVAIIHNVTQIHVSTDD
ncbi:hypothetical protein TNCV_4486751 [Trichonephila clavipes]|nr:hypothetical protein TNCV_4486751 [Trichonephila clavipes]